jgi:hypothetical protein
MSAVWRMAELRLSATSSQLRASAVGLSIGQAIVTFPRGRCTGDCYLRIASTAPSAMTRAPALLRATDGGIAQNRALSGRWHPY